MLNKILKLVELEKIKTKIDKVFPQLENLNTLMFVKKVKTKDKQQLK